MNTQASMGRLNVGLVWLQSQAFKIGVHNYFNLTKAYLAKSQIILVLSQLLVD